MASQSVVAGKKRRADGPPNARSAPKRRKPDIAVQNGQPGEINIANFVKAREFEIKALEHNMKAMRKTLSSRAFQQLPRHMRRRTASHNVKKVPRRLRKRAIKEMKDDNTPTVSKRTKAPSRKLRLRLETAKALKRSNRNSKATRHKKKVAGAKAKGRDIEKEQDPAKQVSITRVPKIKKNTLAKPPTATTKYKRRQVSKTWLPTHLWHAKRAHVTKPTEPLWRLAIPLRPTEKSYRPTHRAAGSRGCVSWDTSYLSTVACVGTDHTLGNLLEALKFVSVRDKVAQSKRWKAGIRFAEGSLHHSAGSRQLLGPAVVIWEPVKKSPAVDQQQGDENAPASSTMKRQKVKLNRRLLIRVHPSIFKDFWTELLRVAKIQKPQVLVEDLRFEIGSIHITGPASTEALLGVLRPRYQPNEIDVAATTWTSLVGLSNAAALPDCAMLAFDIVDPRLSHPPKQIKVPSDQQSLNEITQLTALWPADAGDHKMSLASYKARWIASTLMPSQKSINRRRTEAGAGKSVPVLEKDPPIPVVLLAHRPPGTDMNAQGSWTVMLPWSCVDAVWRSLQYYPISSGSTPRFGSLYQTQQLAFEQMTPWFPADMAGTEAGKAWERTESQKRFDAWMRKPPSRRLRWDMVDIGLGRRGELGRGWMCDWEYLFTDTKPSDFEGQTSNAVPDDPKEDQEMPDAVEPDRTRRNTSSPETSPEPEPVRAPDPDFYQLGPDEASALLDPSKFKPKAQTHFDDIPTIATVRIRLLAKGTPHAGARIYRLPTAPTPSQTASAIPPSNTPSDQQPTQATAAPPPSLPLSAEVHDSTTLYASTSSAPPAAQYSTIPPPSTPSAFSNQPNGTSSHPTVALSLRDRWLALLPPTFHNRSSNTNPGHLSAQNSKQESYHPLSREAFALSKINVFPPNATAEVIEKFDTQPSEEQIAEFENRELLRELLKNDAVKLVGGDGGKGGDIKWDIEKGLVECPDKEDLIGFVTSGGFNLSVGGGTAVGGVWVQRVREGWRDEEAQEGAVLASSGVGSGQRGAASHKSDTSARGRGKAEGKNKSATKTTEAERAKARRVKERTLCVIRNAGSGVGRLGWWEVCE